MHCRYQAKLTGQHPVFNSMLTSIFLALKNLMDSICQKYKG